MEEKLVMFPDETIEYWAERYLRNPQYAKIGMTFEEYFYNSILGEKWERFKDQSAL